MLETYRDILGLCLNRGDGAWSGHYGALWDGDSGVCCNAYNPPGSSRSLPPGSSGDFLSPHVDGHIRGEGLTNDIAGVH